MIDHTKDQIAAIMLQHGTPQQQREALIYLGYPHNMSKDFVLGWLDDMAKNYSLKIVDDDQYRNMAWAFRFVREIFDNFF